MRKMQRGWKGREDDMYGGHKLQPGYRDRSNYKVIDLSRLSEEHNSFPKWRPSYVSANETELSMESIAGRHHRQS